MFISANLTCLLLVEISGVLGQRLANDQEATAHSKHGGCRIRWVGLGNEIAIDLTQQAGCDLAVASRERLERCVEFRGRPEPGSEMAKVDDLGADRQSRKQSRAPGGVGLFGQCHE